MQTAFWEGHQSSRPCNSGFVLLKSEKHARKRAERRLFCCPPGGERAMLRVPVKKTWNPKQTPELELAFLPGREEGKCPGPEPFSSVAQSCQPLCDPMDCSRPGLPLFPELAQTHVHRVGDAISSRSQGKGSVSKMTTLRSKKGKCVFPWLQDTA